MTDKNKEKDTKSKKRLYGYLGVAGIAIAAIIVISILDFLKIQKFIWLYQVIILLLSGIGIYFILRKTCYEYHYGFSKEYFLIHHIVGSRDKVLFSVKYEDIIEFGPLSALNIPPESKKKLDSFYLSATNLDIYYLKYRDTAKDCDKILTFKPSGSVIENLSSKIS